MWRDKNWRFLFLCAGGLWFFVHFSYGVGAFPYPRDVRQPDGSSLTIRVHGDEWYNWVTTADDYRILKNKRGIFEYAVLLKSGELVPSGKSASNPAGRTPVDSRFLLSLPKNLGVSTSDILQRKEEKSRARLKSSNMFTFFPSAGEANLLVILANFSDTEANYRQNAFHRFMNEPDYNGTGSFRDYYQEVSGGLLTVNSVVTQWVRVPWTRQYYAPEIKWSEFAYEAIKAASDAGVDFSLFDNDGDGVVEGVAIIHQGAGQEVTGDENDVWSHSFTLSSAGLPAVARTFSGVVVDQYTIQPEWRNGAGNMNSIGVICHEFGHNLGLHDFYDTTGGIYDGTGRWDIMASGVYNGNPAGSSPAHHNPFSKNDLGWVTQTEINSPGWMVLEPVMTSGQILKVKAPNQNDYLLLENRRRTGFDSYLPGEGLLVYHADSTLITDRRYANVINAYEDQGFYPIPADGLLNDASCPFPGTEMVDELTDYSVPAAITHAGEPFQHSITNIHGQAENISFDYMAIQDGAPAQIGAYVLDSERVKIEWSPSENDYPILLAWSADGVFGVPESGQLYQPGDAIAGGGRVLFYGKLPVEYLHEGLLPSTLYHYSVWSNKGVIYSQNITAFGRTHPAPVTQFPWFDGFEDGLMQWKQETVTGNNEWTVTTEGTQGLPNEAFEGDYFASLRVLNWTVPVTRLISPVLNLQQGEHYFLDFRHVQPVWENDQDILRIMVRLRGGEWEEVSIFDGNTTGWAHRRVRLPYDEPLEIAFEGVSNYGYGIVIDSVMVYAESQCVLPPEISSSSVTASNITENSMIINWVRGNGNATLVVARAEMPVYELPQNGTSYTSNPVFGEGDDLGDNSRVIYSGTDNQVEISGLEHSTDYHFAFFEYSAGSFCYEYTPAVDTFSTRSRKYDIVLEVKDVEGVPVEGASIIMDGVEVFSSSLGVATFSLEHSSLFCAYHVSKVGCSPVSGRILPDREMNVPVTLTVFDPLPPSLLKAEKDYQTINISWNPVINDDFENYESFVTHLNGWTLEDKDQSITYGISGHNFPNESGAMAFMVFDVYADEVLQIGYNSSAYSGSKVLACFASVHEPNDDWIISPVFQVQADDYFSFAGRSLTANFGLEVFNVKVKREGKTNWETLYQGEMAPENWTLFEYNLSAYLDENIQVAIQCVSDDAFALFLDDLRVGPPMGSFPEPPLPYMHVEKGLIKVKPDNIVRKESKAPKKHISQAPQIGAGSVEYQLFKNQSLVATIPGFENVNYVDEDVGCGYFEYTLRAGYPIEGVYSSISDPAGITSCYSVDFKVYDEFGNPVQNAAVTFINETLFTNIDGEVLFEGVAQGLARSFRIEKNEFDLMEGDVDVTADVIVDIVLQKTASSVEETWFDSVALLPNPVKNRAILKGLPPVRCLIEMYDLNGKKVMAENSSGNQLFSIKMESYPAGVYFLTVTANEHVLRMKVVKF